MRKLIGLLIVLATVIPMGCLKSNTSAPVAKSAFFTACSDWNLVTPLLASGGSREDMQGPWDNSGAGGGGQHFVSGVACTIVSSGANADKFLQLLKTEVRQRAAQNNADIIDETDETGGDSADSQITYRTGGNAHGKIEVTLTPAPAPTTPDTQPAAPGVKRYKLKITIDEMSG